MYTPNQKIVVKKRYEFRMETYPTPATAKDLFDTIHAITSKLKELKGKDAANWDDCFHIIPGDEDVVFYFEIDE